MNSISGLCESPAIDWQGHTPYSSDVYFTAKQGLEESEHVYIQGNDLPTRFSQCRGNFVIGEVGFGSGLNFLATVKHWNMHAKHPSARLSYVAFEPYPLAPAQLRHVHAQFHTLAAYSERLLAILPPLVSGGFTLDFASNITLILHHKAVQLWRGRLVVDAWYFDAFAPSQDPQTWSSSVCQQLSGWSKHGTTLSTFSVAGKIRHNLAEQGFEVTRHPGFGPKREMLRAVYAKAKQHKIRLQPKRIAVIGGGLAGCATYAALCELANREDVIMLIERRHKLAERASRNQHAVLFAKMPWLASAQQSWLWHCWCASYSLYSLYPDCFYPMIKTLSLDDKRGTKWFEGWRNVYRSRALQHWMQFDWEHQKVALLRSGRLNMQSIARKLAINASGLGMQQINCSTRLNSIGKSDEQLGIELFKGLAKNRKTSYEQCTHIVLCTNSATATLTGLGDILHNYKGQVNYLKTNNTIQQIHGSNKGYAVPFGDKQCAVGGSFNQDYANLRAQAGEGLSIYQDMAQIYRWQQQGVSEISQWADVRSVAKDHAPLVGEMDGSGLWLNTGFGGKGSLAIVPSSRLLAATIYDDSGGQAVELIRHLSPNRFNQAGLVSTN